MGIFIPRHNELPRTTSMTRHSDGKLFRDYK